MPPGFVLARFEPERSAYWLSQSGRRAAARLSTKWFWALHASITKVDVPFLFVVSFEPSPYPLPSSSLSLGNGRDDAELVVRDKPLPPSDNALHRPLFLHILPALPILHSRGVTPFTLPPVYQLEDESFCKFFEKARAALREANKRRADAQLNCSLKSIKNTWLDPWPGVGGLPFGDGPSDPLAYVFEFKEPASHTIPPSVEPSNGVYDEIMIYNQICVDYRWVGVEAAIYWTEQAREMARSDQAQCPHACTSDLPTEPHLEPDLQELALNLWSKPNPHDRSSSKNTSPANGSHDDSDSSSSGPSSTEYVDGHWEELSYMFGFVPVETIKVVVLDIPGTIVDREGAIRRALALWERSFPNEVQGSTLEALVERYIILEALANRECRNAQSSASLAVFVRAALVALAQELGLPVEENSSLFMETFRIIFNPALWEDVQSAVHALSRRGYTLICQPLHSAATMQHLHSVIPSWFWLNTHTWTQYASPHHTANNCTFEKLRPFCEDVIKTSLTDSEILVVSTNIGRVLHSAQRYGHATAHIKRAGTCEANVRFSVGRGLGSPQPSIVVDSLRELCARLSAT